MGALALAACEAEPPADVSVFSLPEEPPAAESPASVEPAAPRAPAAVAAATEALREAVRDLDPYARVGGLATLLPTLGPEDVPGVKATLRDVTLNHEAPELDLLVRFWASHEPEEALRWAADDCPPGYRSGSVLTAVSRWAAADPLAAQIAAQQLQSERAGLRDSLQIGLAYGWYEHDASELARYIQQQGKSWSRLRLLSTFVRITIQREGPEAAMRWAEAVPEDDPGFKLDVYRQMGVNLAPFDMDAARRWCRAHCEGPYGKGLRTIVAMRWVQLGGGGAALEWLAAPLDERQRELALPQPFAEWLRLFPEEASAWLEPRARADDAEPWLRLLFPPYTLVVMRRAPAEAIWWAERVEDEEHRERLLIRVARAWRAHDEAAAEAWLAESPLSEEARGRARGKAPLVDLPEEMQRQAAEAVDPAQAEGIDSEQAEVTEP
jgi:hypothetical protein